MKSQKLYVSYLCPITGLDFMHNKPAEVRAKKRRKNRKKPCRQSEYGVRSMKKFL